MLLAWKPELNDWDCPRGLYLYENLKFKKGKGCFVISKKNSKFKLQF